MSKGKFYKHPKYGHVYGETLWTPLGRFTWPSLTEPKAPPPAKPGEQPGQPRYEVTILLPKDDPKVGQFFKLVDEQNEEMLKLFNKGRSAKISDVSLCKDGDETDLEKYPYQKGNWVLVARNAKQVGVFASKKEELDAGSIVGGMLGYLLVTPLLTAHGLSYKLEMVRFKADDGTRFGGGVRDMKKFLEEVEDEEGEAETEEVGEPEEEVTEVELEAAEEEQTGVEEEVEITTENNEPEEEYEAPKPPVRKAGVVGRPPNPSKPVAVPPKQPKPAPVAAAAATNGKLTPAQIRAQVIANQKRKNAERGVGGKGKGAASSVL